MTDDANKPENPAIELLVQADEHVALGWAHYVSGEYPQAVDEFRRAIEMGGRIVDAHYGLGLAYRHQGDTARALDELGKAEVLVDDESILMDPARRAILRQLILAQTSILRDSNDQEPA